MYSSACVCVWARCDWRESGALCFLLSLFHMHVFRLCGGDGGWRVIVFRWCYPFVSLSLFPAKEKRFWSLLLAHLPAVYHNVNPTHSQKTDRSRSLGPACLYTKIQITLLYPLISQKRKLVTVFFFLLSTAGSEYKYRRLFLLSNRNAYLWWLIADILHGKCQTQTVILFFFSSFPGFNMLISLCFIHLLSPWSERERELTSPQCSQRPFFICNVFMCRNMPSI